MRPAVDFFEIHPENYMLDRAGLTKIAALRDDYPLSLHAVGLSLGSSDGLDEVHVAGLRELVHRLEPFLVSDHLSWTRIGDAYLNDLLPLPYNRETLDIISRNVEQVQSLLKRQILIENPSAYIQFHNNEFEECEFLRMLVARTGCGLLLDVNNVFVSASNLDYDARAYLAAFPFGAVREIHIAGHQRREVDGETVLIDDHGSVIAEPVWSLYAESIVRAQNAATVIEWDSNLPEFELLLEQRDRAVSVARAARAPKASGTLGALQAGLARTLLGIERGSPQFAYRGHLSVYRNNVRESLTAALRSVYAGIEQLVGPAFFRQTALQFIAFNPPRAASLAGYGSEFADFLAGLQACGHLPYIADVARLEWAVSRASLQRPEPALATEELKLGIANEPARLSFVPQQGLMHLASKYFIDDIWTFARAGGEGLPPRVDGAAFLEISAGEDGIVIRRLEEAEFLFRRELCNGANIACAVDIALQADPLFALSEAFRSILRDGIFTDCRIAQSQAQEMKTCSC
jgi:uncharacterized protein